MVKIDLDKTESQILRSYLVERCYDLFAEYKKHKELLSKFKEEERGLKRRK